MPYAAYLRKSRADAEAEARGEGETLARHRVILTALAARNQHHISRWYEEIVSGETISARPQMQRMLSDVNAKAWEGIYVMDVERLARGDTSDQGLVAQSFKYSNTRIVTPAKIYDPTNEFDEEYFEFSLFMSRREYKTINRRIQAGRMQSIREGKYICSRPAYGYRKVKLKGEKGYSLAVHKEEAAIVRQIFEWYVHGENGERMGLTRISAKLETLRVPYGEEGRTWKPSRIHRILNNEVYLGKIRWGYVKTQRTMTEYGLKKSMYMSGDYELHNGLHEPIVDEALFRAARGVSSSRKNVPIRKNHAMSNPLSGLVFCSACGYALRGKPDCGRQPAAIYCGTRGCPTVRTYREPVESTILGTLALWIDEYRKATVQGTYAEPSTELQDAAIDRMKAERATLDSQKDALHNLLEQGVYTPQVFAERHEVLTKRIKALNASLLELESAKVSKYATIAEIAADIENVLDAYHVAPDAETKNRLLRSVISRVEYTKTVKGVFNHGAARTPADQFELVIFPRLR